MCVRSPGCLHSRERAASTQRGQPSAARMMLLAACIAEAWLCKHAPCQHASAHLTGPSWRPTAKLPCTRAACCLCLHMHCSHCAAHLTSLSVKHQITSWNRYACRVDARTLGTALFSMLLIYAAAGGTLQVIVHLCMLTGQLLCCFCCAQAAAPHTSDLKHMCSCAAAG